MRVMPRFRFRFRLSLFLYNMTCVVAAFSKIGMYRSQRNVWNPITASFSSLVIFYLIRLMCGDRSSGRGQSSTTELQFCRVRGHQQVDDNVSIAETEELSSYLATPFIADFDRGQSTLI